MSETSRSSIIDAYAQDAAARAAERPDATAATFEGTRQVSADLAGRLLTTEIVDDSSELWAAESTQAAEYWRGKANDPTVPESQRTEAAREAEAVQRQADNYTGINDPSIRP